MFSSKDLYEIYYANRAKYEDSFRLKIHRALSWLRRAEETPEDLDLAFIALWIAFNAAYARDLSDFGDRRSFRHFLSEICWFDREKMIYDLVWKKFPDTIRLLLKNKFIFNSFWEHYINNTSEDEYLKARYREFQLALQALKQKRTANVLRILFERLYVLRNQVLHGGSTYNSQLNRKQLSDSCEILKLFIPIMLKIILENHDKTDWGKPYSPAINHKEKGN